MRRVNELTVLAFCLCIIAASTLPGCGRKVSVIETPEPEVVAPEPVVVDVPPPPVEPSPVVVHPFEFNTSLVTKANELEAQLEGRLLWEAARKCRAREFSSDTEARDWLKERWRECEKKASRELAAAENEALAWPEDGTLNDWLEIAALVWAAEAKVADPSIEGELP